MDWQWETASVDAFHYLRKICWKAGSTGSRWSTRIIVKVVGSCSNFFGYMKPSLGPIYLPTALWYSMMTEQRAYTAGNPDMGLSKRRFRCRWLGAERKQNRNIR